MTTRHELSGAEAAAICDGLEQERHIPVRLEVDAESHVVHLWPKRPVSTFEEVVVLGAVLAKTDAPVAWHAAVAS